MHTYPNARLRAIVLLALVSIVIGSMIASAQTVPATAREAAKLPQYAAKLAKSCAAPQNMSLHRQVGACYKQPPGGEDIPLPGPFYANGPSNGLCDIQHCDVDAWGINFGFEVTNSLPASDSDSLGSLVFAAWLFPGDRVISVDWSLGRQPFGSDLGQGTASVQSQDLLFANDYGYEVRQIAVGGVIGNDRNRSGATGAWLTLRNAVTNTGDPLYWDENAGPSLASASDVGTIPSESFNTTTGGSACMPEQSGNFAVIHDFTGAEDGGYPPAGVTLDRAGNLYGLALSSSDKQMVYKMAQAGTGWIMSKLYEFLGGDGGSTPNGLMVGPHDNLYGGIDGGLQNCNGGSCGMIFGLRPQPRICGALSCSWMENIVYRFDGVTDGWNGHGLVADHDGNLYGISGVGGSFQKGAVFKLAPAIVGWTETILYSFAGDLDGGAPNYLIVGNDGNLYGGAASGGAYGSGVIFRLSLSPNGWTESVLYDLPSDRYPANPRSLILDSNGNLFGLYDYSKFVYYPQFFSRVFMLSPAPGRWTLTELFAGNQSWDVDFVDDLVLDAAGNLYGTGSGRSNGCLDSIEHGYIFRLSRNGDGWLFTTPEYWDYTSFDVRPPLALDARGNLYGVTWGCGEHRAGTVWKFATQ